MACGRIAAGITRTFVGERPIKVDIKGYRREDAKEKKAAIETYWVPGVNHLGTHGRWAFAELAERYGIEGGLREEGRVRVQSHGGVDCERCPPPA